MGVVLRWVGVVLRWVGVLPEWVWCLGGRVLVQIGLSKCELAASPNPQGPWHLTTQSESALDGSVRTVNKGALVVQYIVQIASL